MHPMWSTELEMRRIEESFFAQIHCDLSYVVHIFCFQWANNANGRSCMLFRTVLVNERIMVMGIQVC